MASRLKQKRDNISLQREGEVQFWFFALLVWPTSKTCNMREAIFMMVWRLPYSRRNESGAGVYIFFCTPTRQIPAKDKMCCSSSLTFQQTRRDSALSAVSLSPSHALTFVDRRELLWYPSSSTAVVVEVSPLPVVAFLLLAVRVIPYPPAGRWKYSCTTALV